MIISIENWLFDVDMDRQMEYSSKNLAEHCCCGYCRNFYAAVDEKYPNLRQFLPQFGAHVEAPNELMPFEPTICQVTYCICGSILQYGSEPISVGGTTLEVLPREELEFDTECPAPSFAFVTGYLELPWVLPEDMDEVISPANEPEYLERMWNKLLTEADGTIQS